MDQTWNFIRWDIIQNYTWQSKNIVRIPCLTYIIGCILCSISVCSLFNKLYLLFHRYRILQVRYIFPLMSCRFQQFGLLFFSSVCQISSLSFFFCSDPCVPLLDCLCFMRLLQISPTWSFFLIHLCLWLVFALCVCFRFYDLDLFFLIHVRLYEIICALCVCFRFHQVDLIFYFKS